MTTTTTLSSLDVAALSLVEAEADVARLEAELRNAKAHRDYVASRDMVEAMRDAGVERVDVPGGGEIVLRDHAHVRVAEKRREEMLVWLKGRGQTNLMTCTLSIQFARGEYTPRVMPLAKMLGEWLDKQGWSNRPVVTFSVHSATLKKFVNDEYVFKGKGSELPECIDWYHAPLAEYIPPREAQDAEAAADSNQL